MFDDLFKYLSKDNCNSIYIGDEPHTIYLLAKLSAEDGIPMIKSLIDENGKCLHGFGFVYLNAYINDDFKFYKFIIPIEYFLKVRCSKGIPYGKDIIEYKNFEAPLSSIKDWEI